MVQVVKSEWHQVEKRYAIELDDSILFDVYPDMSLGEREDRLQEIIDGEYSIEQFLEDADEENVCIDWDWLDEDDWWTDRKGGYEVTYKVNE